jgi:glycosyltransferase involved in cell wall biosynthesis
MVVELGSVPYERLHQVYSQAGAYVTPAYTETFAHPLVEAMASGVPVVASDLAVHREICGDAAAYFPAFAPQRLAESVATVLSSPALAKELGSAGLRRSRDFSWLDHVAAILALSRRLAGSA